MDWATKMTAMTGETESGDRVIVKLLDDGMLIAVIDGLGHGHAAAVAADLAVSTIENNASLDLAVIMQLCHNSLAGKRGAVISLVRLEPDDTLTWLGIGNVEVSLLRNQHSHLIRSVERPVLRSGLVGQGQLPPMQSASVQVRYNDLVFMATDGINPGFTEDIDVTGMPEEIAAEIMSNHASSADDALVFVGRYRV